MSNPQQSSDRYQQKRRRTKQLAEWRLRQASKTEAPAAAATPAAKPAAATKAK